MADPMQLLNDEEVQRFIVDGCMTVHADYPPSFHANIYDQIEAVFEKEGNPGNNILPRIPQIGQVFEHPNVKGALTSLLGPGYILNPHRHCHLNPPGRNGQQWHKDCYVYDHNLRHPRFYWVLAFYFPQDTTEDMGPSGVLPGMQIYKTISDVDPAQTKEKARAFCGPAGTVALIHFDSWHRATENISTKKRYMLKFQFARTQEPQKPTWDHQSRAWSPGIEDRHPAISQDVWNWMCGNTQKERDTRQRNLKNLIQDLQNGPECERLDAGYKLAEFGTEAVPELIAAMREETLATIEETEAKTPDNAHGTNPTSGCAALSLFVHRRTRSPRPHRDIIRPPLVGASGCCQYLGTYGIKRGCICTRFENRDKRQSLVGAPQCDRRHWAQSAIFPPELLSDLTQALGDEDYRVRRNAALTLAKFGESGDTAVEPLATMLEDENRYNRFYATYVLAADRHTCCTRHFIPHPIQFPVVSDHDKRQYVLNLPIYFFDKKNNAKILFFVTLCISK